LRPRGLLLLTLLAAAPGLRADDAVAAPATRAEMKEQQKATRQQLKGTKAAILKARQDRHKAERQEHSLKTQLEQLNRELEAARREQRVHVRNLGLAEDKLRNVRSQLDLKQAEAAADHDALEQDLARLYRARQRQGAAMIFSAHSPAELAIRAHYLEALSSATHRREAELAGDIQSLEGYRREYKDQEQAFKQKTVDAQAARQQAQLQYLRKQALLKDVRARKVAAATTERDLEEAAKQREAELDALQRSIAAQALRQRQQARLALGRPDQARRSPGHGRPSPNISAMGTGGGLHGGLPWPVAGRVVSRYGKQEHPIYHVPVFNRGIQIAAPYGSGVRAIAGGTVVHAAEMEGFGELVVLDHGNSMMSVYGYGSQVHVAEGQRVEQGDLLEDVGEAGDSTQPSLYFEIRQGAKALDPLRYLRRHG
jgi:septal ring factor EnvC (AmiA/AmiB activator)